MRKNIIAGVSLVALSAGTAQAAGLERSNVDISFLFSDDASADIAIANVTPNFNPTNSNMFSFSASNVATSFSINTLDVKTEIFDNLVFGLWRTNSGNGVSIDYGVVSGAGATGAFNPLDPTEVTNQSTIKADLSIPSTMLVAKYQLNDSTSVIGGIKHVSVSGGELSLPAELGANDPYGDDRVNGVGPIDTTATWSLGSKQAMGAVIGAAYEIDDIALRVSVLHETSIDLNVGATGVGVAAGSGATESSLGDATSIAFQTGIAEDTLLFGSIRYSNWEDNQIKLPNAAGVLTQVSAFDDGVNYTLGIGRKLSEKLSTSLSYYFSDGSGVGVSELAPFGDTKTLSIGARYALSDSITLSGGYSHSERGDATTGTFGAAFTGSTVKTLGIKLTAQF